LQKISKEHPKYEPEEYEGLVQLYVFHVLPSLQEWDEAFRFINTEQAMNPWKIEGFKLHLTVLKNEVAPIDSKELSLTTKTENIQDTVIQPSEKVLYSDKRASSIHGSTYVNSLSPSLPLPSFVINLLLQLKKNWKIWTLLCSVSLALAVAIQVSARQRTLSNSNKKNLSARLSASKSQAAWSSFKNLLFSLINYRTG